MLALVVDAQGGGIGQKLVAALRKELPALTVRAVGTNSAATLAMKKAGAQESAAGENAVKVGAREADFILGPIGIVIADALQGEITAKMAKAIGKSRAVRILIPVNHCQNLIAGTQDLPLSRLIEDAVQRVVRLHTAAQAGKA